MKRHLVTCRSGSCPPRVAGRSSSNARAVPAISFCARELTRFGARHLKRAIQRHPVFPFANLIATEQVQLGDVITVDYCPTSSKLIFSKEDQGALADSLDEVEAEMAVLPASDGYAESDALHCPRRVVHYGQRRSTNHTGGTNGGDQIGCQSLQLGEWTTGRLLCQQRGWSCS